MRDAQLADFQAFPTQLVNPPEPVVVEHIRLGQPLPDAAGTCLSFAPDSRGASGWLYLASQEMVGPGGSGCHQAVEAWLRCEDPTSGQVYLGLCAATGMGGNGVPVGLVHQPFGYWVGLGRSFPGNMDPVPGLLTRVPLVLRFADGMGGGLYGRQLEVLGDFAPGQWVRVRLELMLVAGGHLLRVLCGVPGAPLAQVGEVEVLASEVGRYRSGVVQRPAMALCGRARGRGPVAFIHDLRWEAVLAQG